MDVPSEGSSVQNQALIEAAESALKKQLEYLDRSYNFEASTAVIAAAYGLQVARGETPAPLSISFTKS